LIINALQSIENVKGGKVKFNVFVDGPKIIFEVIDNGDGIKQEEKDKVFKPYYTTKGKRVPDSDLPS